MKLLKLIALAIGCIVAFSCAALAATPAVAPVAAAAIPVGKYVAAFLAFWTFAITSLAVWAAKRYIPPAYAWLVSPDMIANAVHYALAAIEGQVAGETIAPEAVNSVVQQAISYLVANEPAFAKWAGDTLRPKIVAWMSAQGMLSADTKASVSPPAGGVIVPAVPKAV